MLETGKNELREQNSFSQKFHEKVCLLLTCHVFDKIVL